MPSTHISLPPTPEIGCPRPSLNLGFFCLPPKCVPPCLAWKHSLGRSTSKFLFWNMLSRGCTSELHPQAHVFLEAGLKISNRTINHGKDLVSCLEYKCLLNFAYRCMWTQTSESVWLFLLLQTLTSYIKYMHCIHRKRRQHVWEL
jgi:hypothetical protein